jgi:hypothetical protein
MVNVASLSRYVKARCETDAGQLRVRHSTPHPTRVPREPRILGVDAKCGAPRQGNEHRTLPDLTLPGDSGGWRQASLILAFLLVGALIPTILALREDPVSALDPNLLAIAPSRVFNPEHEIWGEGVVDFLSRSLDNAGELRTLTPMVAVRAWPGRADVESAEVTGHRTGSGLVVFDSLLLAAAADVAASRLWRLPEGGTRELAESAYGNALAAHPKALFMTWIRLWLLADSTELAIQIARISAEREHDPRYRRTAPVIVNRNLAASLAYRGHMRESVEMAGGEYATWFQSPMPGAAMLGFIDAEVADSSFADWLEQEKSDPNVLPHELWWWDSRSDTAAIQRYLERGGHDSISLAALALVRGDTADAILKLETVEPDRLGQTEQALRDYRFVSQVWADADPELQPIVREAEEAVALLGG